MRWSSRRMQGRSERGGTGLRENNSGVGGGAWEGEATRSPTWCPQPYISLQPTAYSVRCAPASGSG